MTRLAIYPGTFDPITLGHVDIITRGAALFDQVIVAVAINVTKTPLFSAEERQHLIRESIPHLPNVRVTGLDGLIVTYAQQQGATAILRGLRTVADFENEFHMATMNRRLAPTLETVFLPAGEGTACMASHLIKEIAAMSGDVRPFVPLVVVPALLQAMAKRRVAAGN